MTLCLSTAKSSKRISQFCDFSPSGNSRNLFYLLSVSLSSVCLLILIVLIIIIRKRSRKNFQENICKPYFIELDNQIIPQEEFIKRCNHPASNIEHPLHEHIISKGRFVHESKTEYLRSWIRQLNPKVF